jgi:hypothetical protein
MAPSDLSGWGLFALQDLPQANVPFVLGQGDVVIAVSDPHPAHIGGMNLLLRDYLWESGETGQQYEGQTVYSVLPSIGMLANGHSRHFNFLPEREPTVGDCGVTRDAHPGAGAISPHYNLSFYLQRPIPAGTELLVNYGQPWFRERNISLDDPPPILKHTDWLLDCGYCVDNIRPGISPMGRGALSSRFLPKGSIVAPVPVLPLTRDSLKRVRQYVSGELLETEQLLLNYCLGHSKSSLLLYPYAPFINLINHSGESPNAKWQWVSHQFLEWSIESILKMSESGLLLELVALNDIQDGEEIFVHYGTDWQHVWDTHVQHWTPFSKKYIPSYNYSLDVLRTDTELKQDPYPDNIFTSCFYRYRVSEHSGERVTVDRWKESKDVWEMTNLRPCAVLDREDDQLYTVQIHNRFGLKPEERLGRGKVHVVTHIPRHAIRFSDKLYTTDPHLEHVFRHEIGLSVFPSLWMDLK